MAPERDYNAAITALNTLQSNFSIVDAIRKSGVNKNKDAIPEMQEWCRRVGYEPSEFSRLNIIHVAGTKGKGSTSALISSILYEYASESSSENGAVPRKIGLYTSPHLQSVRERIQINNEPLSEKLFARYFFEVWDRLEESASRLGPPSFAVPSQPSGTKNADGESAASQPTPPETKPVYFRYLTLMAFHAYISEGVDTAIIECGIGGEYDSTNIIVAPVVAAVTSLGIDHTAMLGNTIEDIAWHKAGIFKSDSRVRAAYTVDSQPESAMDVLHDRAMHKGLSLRIVPRRADIDSGEVRLGLAADFQKINASLAIAVAAAHLRALGCAEVVGALDSDGAAPQALPAPFRRGLANVQWGGRCEVRRERNIAWHLDGGHTLESIRLAAAWFAGRIGAGADEKDRSRQQRILLFNQQTRDAGKLAEALYAALDEALPRTGAGGGAACLFDRAVFSTNITFAAAEDKDGATGRYKPDLLSMNTSSTDVEKLTVQRGLADTWGALDASCDVAVRGTIEEAIADVRAHAEALDEGGEAVVLVTGSLHLVGGVLEVLESR